MGKKTMTFEQIYKIVDKIPFNGWMTLDDCHVIFQYASQIEGTLLEIGAWAGRSGVCLALSSPKSKIYSVENCSEEIETPWVYEYKQGEPTKQLKDNVAKYDNWELIIGDSSEVAKTWTKPLDLLLIDGAHNFISCSADIKSWFPYVKDKGIILMHDWSHIDSVREAVGAHLKAERLDTNYKTQFGIFRK